MVRARQRRASSSGGTSLGTTSDLAEPLSTLKLATDLPDLFELANKSIINSRQLDLEVLKGTLNPRSEKLNTEYHERCILKLVWRPTPCFNPSLPPAKSLLANQV